MSRGPDVVLLNGAWHGAWCWSLVIRHLARRGVLATAVEVDGLGTLDPTNPAARSAKPYDHQRFRTEPSGVAGVTLEGAASRLIDDLRGLDDAPVVVAHSLAGVVLVEAAERAPGLFAGLVLVSAVPPVAGRTVSANNGLPEMRDSLMPSLFVADPAVVGALRCDFDSPEGQDRARRALFHDVPEELAQQAISHLGADAPAGFDRVVEVSADRLGTIPRTWVLCTEDRAVTPALQRRLITELDAVRDPAGRPTHVVELAASHSPFLSRPAELAAVIAAAARAAGRRTALT